MGSNSELSENATLNRTEMIFDRKKNSKSESIDETSEQWDTQLLDWNLR